MAYDRTTTPRWKRLRKAVKERDEYRCVRCNRSAEDGFKLEVDHIIEYADGGEDEMYNLQTLCRDYCHQEKTTANNRERRVHKPRPTVEWL